MNIERSSGLLLHITSLPSPYGIGDLGEEAYRFINFLHESGHKYWQILPLNPTEYGSGCSPYSSPSAFAGNILLISPNMLKKEGYVSQADIKHNTRFTSGHVDFRAVIDFKKQLLEKAWQRFSRQKKQDQAFTKFCEQNQSWLEDHALYMALRAHFTDLRWLEWPTELRDRQPRAISEAREQHAKTIVKEQFFQFLFFRQWQQLLEYAHQKDIHLIGDMPFYVSHDSVDCWANAKYFKLDKNKQPTRVSGVPPDYFSATGQLWGTPVYDWKVLQKEKFSWWVERVRQNLRLFDMVRFDHFRAFSAFWEVPAGEETAINGHWQKCPGNAFFKQLKSTFPEMPFVAEDLGSLDPPVHHLRDRFGLPGMRVLLFAFGEDMPHSSYIPHHHIANSIVYTGTHDNNTVKGWLKNASTEDKARLSAYTGRRITAANVARTFQRMALGSVANLVIIPVQDILGLGEEAMMNRPGTTSGNWTWRLSRGKLTKTLARELKTLNTVYAR